MSSWPSIGTSEVRVSYILWKYYVLRWLHPVRPFYNNYLRLLPYTHWTDHLCLKQSNRSKVMKHTVYFCLFLDKLVTISSVWNLWNVLIIFSYNWSVGLYFTLFISSSQGPKAHEDGPGKARGSLPTFFNIIIKVLPRTQILKKTNWN